MRNIVLRLLVLLLFIIQLAPFGPAEAMPQKLTPMLCSGPAPSAAVPRTRVPPLIKPSQSSRATVIPVWPAVSSHPRATQVGRC